MMRRWRYGKVWGWMGTQSWAGWVVSGTGLALAGLSLWYLIVIQALNFGAAAQNGLMGLVLKAIEIALLASFSLVLVYGGYWLAASQFEKERAWWAGLWTMLGLAGIVAIVALMTAVRIQRGEVISPPTVIQEMLLAAGGGALAGLLIGISTIRETVESERARKQQNTLLFVNELLRHNVLNGMNIITGNMDLLEPHVDEEGQQYLETTEERADDIVDLIQNVRTLMQSISEENSLKPVDLSSVLDREVQKARRTYPAATIQCNVDNEPTVIADGLLEAVFENLLRNAIEHNDSHQPEVYVTTSNSDDSAVVKVVDNGPGIPDDRKAAYFKPGEQNKGSVGQGLGLYLVDTLVERYGGDVWIEDNEPAGSIVAVELPRVV